MKRWIPGVLILILIFVLGYHVHWFLAAERVICNIKLKGYHIILPDKDIIMATGSYLDHIISYDENEITYKRHIWISNPDRNKYIDCLQELAKWQNSIDCDIHLIYPNNTIFCYFKPNDIFGIHLRTY